MQNHYSNDLTTIIKKANTEIGLKGGEKFMKMSTIDWTAWVFVVVGALNWGFVGLFKFNLVEMIFGLGTLSTLVYTLVGLSGLYMLWGALSKKK